jgi:hypothetical protein
VWLVLKTWVRDHFAHDFQHNPELVKRLQKFIFIRVAKVRSHRVCGRRVACARLTLRVGGHHQSLANPAAKLITQLHRLMADDGVKMEAIIDDMPKPIMPRSRSFRRLSFSLSQRARNDLSPLSKFMDFHPLELARQLTLVESSYFRYPAVAVRVREKIRNQHTAPTRREIQPKECLKLCWSTDKANAPNILGLINHFNAVSFACSKCSASTQRSHVSLYCCTVERLRQG